jgi:hypothetical protein
MVDVRAINSGYLSSNRKVAAFGLWKLICKLGMDNDDWSFSM